MVQSVIEVVWLKGRKLCVDQHLVSQWLEDPLFHHVEHEIPAGTGGCILVVPARYVAPEDVQKMIDSLSWVIIVLTSDEESTFDHAALSHPNMRLWVMTPRPDRHAPSPRNLAEGIFDDTSDYLRDRDPLRRPVDVFFAGQVTHLRREQLISAMKKLPESVHQRRVETPGFMQGLTRKNYLHAMSEAKVVPCPSGPATPDSFRLIEALEAGAVPIADGRTPDPDYPLGYWPLVFNERPPFPVVETWNDLEKEVMMLLRDWEFMSVRCRSWWLQKKREQRECMLRDALELSGLPDPVGPDNEITVVIPTSPIPSHPSTEVIEQTVASVRAQLPRADILITCDGVRSEQSDRFSDYYDYLQRLNHLCAHVWTNVTPIHFTGHHHQANMARKALELVDTPCILYVEHDTPMTGEIDWNSCVRAVRTGRANVIRYHFEAFIPEPHRHMMLDVDPVDVEGAPLVRTVQWSQRPHLASTGFYRTMIDTYFGHESRTMIEDVMHGVVWTTSRKRRVAGWEQFRVWIYHPEGSIKRSENLDGRATDPKYDMIYAYDKEKPFGAPAETTSP